MRGGFYFHAREHLDMKLGGARDLLPFNSS